MTDAPAPILKIKLQIFCGAEIAMGPGKADLLDAIARKGSISAAGRDMGMSYRRAWLLVDAMNRCWREPLVATSAGGPNKGGARLTPFGERTLATYRGMQAAANGVRGDAAWRDLAGDVLSAPKPHQKSGE